MEKEVEKEERIVKDLKTMSQKEKLKLLKKESPELLELIQDFKAKVKACINDIYVVFLDCIALLLRAVALSAVVLLNLSIFCIFSLQN